MLKIIFIITILIFFSIFLKVPVRRFFKDMPKDIFKKGKYKPYAFRRWEITDSKPYYSKIVYKRLIFAYISARLIAWKLDIKSLGEGCGICWGIKYLNIGDGD